MAEGTGVPFEGWVEPPGAGSGPNELFPEQMAGPISREETVWLDPKVPLARLPSPSEAENALLGMTGLPDLQAAGQAAERGEVLGALGRGLWGGAQAASWLVPGMRGALRFGEALAPGLGADVSGMVRAYHGTRHLFDRFADEAVGTGEGAQAYGWGHYVAGHPSTAESYRLAGAESTRPELLWEGKPTNFEALYAGKAGEVGAQRALATLRSQGSVSSALGTLRSALQRFVDSPEYRYHAGHPQVEELKADLENSISWINSNRDKLHFTEAPKGNLLEVHILPEEEELLDWDERISPEMKEKVKKVIEKIDPYGDEPETVLSRIDDAYGKLTGEAIYRSLAQEQQNHPWDRGGAKIVSKALHEAGIPGLKFLDARSRGLKPYALQSKPFIESPETQGKWDTLSLWDTKERAEREARSMGLKAGDWQVVETPRTRNYVIFDPSNLRIVGRNGERLIPIEEDPFAKPKGKP